MTRSIILKDGGTGQELIHRSSRPPHPLWSAKVMLEEPDLVRQVHADFIAAGARLITLNTYSTTPERLAREGAADMVRPLYARALELAQEARDQIGADGVRLAACLPPLHGSYHPDLSRTHDDLLPAYREIAALQAEGTDVMLAETLSSVAEATAAAQAGTETGLPTIVSLTLRDEPTDTTATLRSGEPLSDALAALENSGIAIISLNCSRPETVSRHLPELASTGLPFGAYANGFRSVEPLEIGGTVTGLEAREDVTPERYTSFALDWLDTGATFLGGCCEISPAHIGHLAQTLTQRGLAITAEIP